MIYESIDVLWLTVSVCIALLTLFSCWGIFYIVQIIRRSSKMFKGIEQMIFNINETIKTTKEKIEHSAAYVSILADGIKKVMEIAQQEGKKVRSKK